MKSAGVLTRRDGEARARSAPICSIATWPASIASAWRNPVVRENTSTSKRGSCITAANGSIAAAAARRAWSWPGARPRGTGRRTPGRDDRRRAPSNPHRPHGDFDAEPISCFPLRRDRKPTSTSSRSAIRKLCSAPERRCLHTGPGDRQTRRGANGRARALVAERLGGLAAVLDSSAARSAVSACTMRAVGPDTLIAAHGRAGVVEQRRGDAADALLVLLVVDRVAAPADACEVVLAARRA